MYKILLFVFILSNLSYSQTLSDSANVGASKYMYWTDNDGYLYQPKPKAKLIEFDGIKAGAMYRFGKTVQDDLLLSLRTGLNIRGKTNINLQILTSFKYSQFYYKIGIERNLF